MLTLRTFKYTCWLVAVTLVLSIYSIIYFHGYSAHGVSSIFSQLADGFRQGQLHLPTEPKPELLRLPDPYDPALNQHKRFHDMSLYNNHYYVYFGPANSFFLLIAGFLGIHGVTDSSLVLLWSCLLAIVTAVFFNFFTNSGNLAMLLNKPESQAKSLPFGMIFAGYFLCVLNPGILTCIVRPLFYEAAISLASLMFWLGLLAGLYGARDYKNDGDYNNNQTHSLFTLSGLAFGLCFLSRNSYGPAIALVTLAIPALLYFKNTHNQTVSYRKLLTASACLYLPIAAALISTFAYNYARFGSLTESGFSYVLANEHQHNLSLEGKMFNRDSIPSNIYLFLLRPFEIAREFPFLMSATSDLPAWTHPPSFYVMCSTMAGVLNYDFILYTMTLTGLIALVTMRKQSSRREEYPATAFLTFLTGSLLVTAAAATLFPLLLLHVIDRRYITDFISLLSAAAVFFSISGMSIITRSSPAITRTLSVFTYSAILVSIFTSLMMTMNYGTIKTASPDFFNSLAMPANAFINTVTRTHIVQPVNISSQSQQDNDHMASNLLLNDRSKDWATNNGLNPVITFSFQDPFVLRKIILEARNTGLNEFWHYYQIAGYLHGKMIYKYMRAADDPIRNHTQSLKFGNHSRVDQIVITGLSPVLSSQHGTLYSQDVVNPGFSFVRFLARN